MNYSIMFGDISKEVETRACDDTIRRLRKKIESSQVQIETVWGFGFKIGKKHV
jgi:DNA-binding response OmpR family regulator